MVHVLVVLALHLAALSGCGQANSPAEKQERRGGVEQAQQREPTRQEPEIHGVGDTAKLGPLLVTLNGVRDHSFETYTSTASPGAREETYPGHYYAVVDVTIENRAQTPVDAFEVSFVLSDREGYSFQTEPLTDQKPEPQGQALPGGKVSGEIGYDLGTRPNVGPFLLSASLVTRPDVPPATFKFRLE